MQVCELIEQTVDLCQDFRKNNCAVIFIPTMGSLHEGHIQLIRMARSIVQKERGVVVVSVFVNRKQFGQNEDFHEYPRNLARDKEICEQENVDIFFHPSEEEMYQDDFSISILENNLSSHLCGISRPCFFGGILTVISLLFHIIRPSTIILGEKDWQQYLIISRLIKNLKWNIKIFLHPTVRDQNGLAISSRNQLLTADQLMLAPKIFHSLTLIKHATENGEFSTEKLLILLIQSLREIPGIRIDYTEILEEITLNKIQSIKNLRTRAFVAIYFQSIRLIDNIALPFYSSNNESI